MTKKTWKLKKGTTWRQKLETPHPSHGKVVAIPARMHKSLGPGTMVIPHPLDLDAAVRKVRKGKLITMGRLRNALAKLSGTDAACPLTTGIFMRIVAETAEEDRRAGKQRITPYWRAIKGDGKLNEKFPGGAKAQAALLRKDGFTIQAGKGKQPPKVKDYESHLV